MPETITRSERLHPEVRALLEMMDAQGAPPLESQDPAEARGARVEGMKLMGGEPIALERVEDLSVPGPGGDIPVRVYAPDVAGFVRRWSNSMAADSCSAISRRTTLCAAPWRRNPERW